MSKSIIKGVGEDELVEEWWGSDEMLGRRGRRVTTVEDVEGNAWEMNLLMMTKRSCVVDG